MDPNANIEEQGRILERANGGRVEPAEARARLRELRAALAEWLVRGGFAPDWSRASFRVARYYGKGARS